MGAGAQFRMVGSALALAICTTVFNSYARGQLQTILGSGGVDDAIAVLTSASADAAQAIPPGVRDAARLALFRAYNRQSLVLCASAGLQVPATLLMWRREQIRI